MIPSIVNQPLNGNSPSEIRILPAGSFRALDGSNRPSDVGAWVTSASIARSIISSSFMGKKDILIDYDHQSLAQAKNGQPAPAAGWFSGLEWREGLGLFAVGIKWNAKALALIAAHEYRFISPVFTYEKPSGAVQQIISVAITNNPAIPDLFDLSSVAAASSGYAPPSSAERNDPRNQRGYELLDRINGVYNPDLFNSSSVAATSSGYASPSSTGRNDPRNQRGYELLDRINGLG